MNDTVETVKMSGFGRQELHEKLWRLKSIERVCHAVDEGRLPPNKALALAVGIGSGIATFFFLLGFGGHLLPFPWQWVMVLSVPPFVGVVAGKILLDKELLAASWGKELESQLSEYEPINSELFADLKDKALAHKGFILSDVNKWLEEERGAVQGAMSSIFIPAD